MTSDRGSCGPVPVDGGLGDRGLGESDPGESDLAVQLDLCALAPAKSVTPLVFNPNNPVTGVVERVQLTDGTDVVRKVVCRDRPVTVAHWPAGQRSGHWNYWRREVHAYDSGLTAAFDGAGIRGPLLRGRCSPEPGVEVLFLEAVDGRSGPDLASGDLASVAYCLGSAQGRPSVDLVGLADLRTAPPWWSREWMWAYATSRPPGPGILDDAAAWEHPTVVEGFGEQRHRLRSAFREVVAELPVWRDVAAGVPRTVSHLDCWANNLVVPAPGAGDPTLVDWSFVGVGMVGEDAGNLVADGLLDHYMAPDDYAELERTVWDAYSSGLADAGWPGEIGRARLGMCLSVLKFCWLPGLMVANVGHGGATGYGGQPGLDEVEVFRRRSEVLQQMLGLLDEARRLSASA